MTDVELFAQHPDIPWRTPVRIVHANARPPRWACRICMRLRVVPLDTYATTIEVLEHIAYVHPACPGVPA